MHTVFVIGASVVGTLGCVCLCASLLRRLAEGQKLALLDAPAAQAQARHTHAHAAYTYAALPTRAAHV